MGAGEGAENGGLLTIGRPLALARGIGNGGDICDVGGRKQSEGGRRNEFETDDTGVVVFGVDKAFERGAVDEVHGEEFADLVGHGCRAGGAGGGGGVGKGGVGRPRAAGCTPILAPGAVEGERDGERARAEAEGL